MVAHGRTRRRLLSRHWRGGRISNQTECRVDINGRRRSVLSAAAGAFMSVTTLVLMLLLAYRSPSVGWRIAALAVAALSAISLALEVRALRRARAGEGASHLGP